MNSDKNRPIARCLRLAAICLISLAATATAQHYPIGVEGLKGAALPPPGLYLRDYNVAYTADEFPGGPPDFNVFAYINAPRLIWITEKQFLGASYGMDVIVPFGYERVKVMGKKDDRFGLTDLQVEPLVLAWHEKKFDAAFGYAIWAPSGEFDKNRLANLGKGFWSHMLTGGATWYPDDEKAWAVNLLNRYEFSHEQEDTGITPGQMLTMEWGVSRTVCKGTDAGLAGYLQQETTKTTGASELSHVIGFGPEVSTLIPQIGMFASLRYIWEADASNRPKGHNFILTLTKRF